MFGIFYGLYSCVMSITNYLRNSYNDELNKMDSIKNNSCIYKSHNGWRYTKNNRLVRKNVLDNGDEVLMDLYNNNIYINYTKEIEKRKRDEAIKNKCTVLRVDKKSLSHYREDLQHKSMSDNITPQYKDLFVDKFYIHKSINNITFYMDVINGELVRVSDQENFKNKIGSISPPDIIKIVNRRQRDIVNKFSKNDKPNYWWDKYFYLNLYSIIVDNDGNIIEGNLLENHMMNAVKRLKKED